MARNRVKVFSSIGYYLPPVMGTVSTVVLVAALVGGSIAYYTYESQGQVIKEPISNERIYINSRGQYCCRFEPGEHKIKISRNDSLYHKIKEKQGYAIQEVEINGWRDNNKVTYINTVPVIAIGKKDNNGDIMFDDFGREETVYDIVEETNGRKAY